MKIHKTLRPIRFSLKWLLVLVLLAAVATCVATQVGMVTAQFEITLNQLRLDDNGNVAGPLGYRYARAGRDSTEYFDFVCFIKNLERPDLLELSPGQRFKVRYRLYDIGPLKKQNAYFLFLTDKLHITKEQYLGFSNAAEWTEIVIDGAR